MRLKPEVHSMTLPGGSNLVLVVPACYLTEDLCPAPLDGFVSGLSVSSTTVYECDVRRELGEATRTSLLEDQQWSGEEPSCQNR